MKKKYILVKGNTYGKYYTRNTFDHYYSLWSIDGRGYIQCEVDNISSYDEIKDEYDVSNKEDFIKISVIILSSWELDGPIWLQQNKYYKIFKSREALFDFLEKNQIISAVDEELGVGYAKDNLFFTEKTEEMNLSEL